MRLFIAVDTDPALHPVLSRVVEHLRSAGADARWTGPEQWHVTLRFIGETDDAMAGRVAGAMRRIAAAGQPAALRLAGLGTFGGPKPRVVAAKVDDLSGVISAAARSLEGEVRLLGFAPENRPFTPHITLARVRSPRNAAALADAVRCESASVKGEWLASELVLYLSTLKPGGAEYEALARARLGG
ncbi:MAG: RNA 2',3'-cyclic phosphodiesterase [Planctomycetia bacterium]|nr:RNA 2',3'-cyclic phosphodiesterase [Planctomycetia bacterium]